jgi:2-methylcitrate dehydratase PrpD
MTRTEQLAGFIVDTDYDSIPKELIHLAKKAILDLLGVTLAGSKLEPSAELVAKYAGAMGGGPEAAILGKGLKVPAEIAGMANGTIGHALDYDDTFPIHLGIPAHPSVPVVPSVLALGEKYRIPGKKILASLMLGLEVEARLGLAFGHHLVELGWHITPIIGSIGAAAAASRILELDLRKVQNALGIAASLSCGLKQNFGTMTKPFHAGCGARNGIAAAALAGQGFTANENIFDVPASFLGAFSGGREPDATCLTRELGSSWIMSNGIGFKPYPSCRASHCGVDAALFLKERNQLNPSKITEVTCHPTELVGRILSHHQPRTYLEAKFSLEYCVSTALLNGRVALEHFTPQSLSSPGVQQLMSRVRVIPTKHESPGKDGDHGLTTRIRVVMDDGKEYSHEVSVPKGEPENPMTEEDFSIKFMDCARYALSNEAIDKCMDRILNLESLSNVGELMDLFYGS